MMQNIEIKQVPINDLKPADYNPRRWSEKAISELKESIKRFGLVDPIIANKAPGRENIIIGGHFRWYIAKELGYKEAPVVYIDVPDIAREMELNLRLNKNTGEFDWNLLANFGSEVLLDVGFTSEELDRGFGLGGKDEDEFDVEKELEAIETPNAKIGQVYQLGRHRLMCGDSTNQEHVKTLMGGVLADLVFTDPPYNVNYSGRGKNTSNTILNDHMENDAFQEFLNAVFARYTEATKPNAPLYTCYASSTHREFQTALEKNGWDIKNQIIWVKMVASMGWGDYRWKHEPILYAHKHGNSTQFFGDRKQYTEWKEEKSDIELLDMVKKMIEKEEQGDSTVWRLKRDSKYDHPTQKPLQLVKIALQNSSKRGDVVLDLFGGSGSTLIACEQSERTGYSMELDPKYVDVIIKRYEKETGETAELIAE